MNRLLLLAIPLALAACSSEQAPQESAEDFASARAEVSTPVSGHYKDLEVVEHPPNGQGATALLLMNILDHFDIAGMDPLGAERLHIEAEATKLAYDTRNRFMSDPASMTRLVH